VIDYGIVEIHGSDADMRASTPLISERGLDRGWRWIDRELP